MEFDRYNPKRLDPDKEEAASDLIRVGYIAVKLKEKVLIGDEDDIEVQKNNIDIAFTVITMAASVYDRWPVLRHIDIDLDFFFRLY